MKQYSLFKVPSLAHGGNLLQGKRKLARPLARGRPIHLILKASRDFGVNAPLVLSETRRLAEKFRVRIHDHALAEDHLHLVITIPARKEYAAFVRSLSGLLARKFGRGIWEQSPFTRVGHWGKSYRALGRYLEQNRLETAGVMPYQRRVRG